MENLRQSIKTLQENYAPLSAVPAGKLLNLVRTYELDPGDQLSFGTTREECIFVVSGEVLQSDVETGEETVLDPESTLARPVIQLEQQQHFTARKPSILGRINPSGLDFLLSWEGLETDHPADKSFHQWLENLRNPLIFKRLPLENAYQVFRRLQLREAKAGEVIFDMGEEATQFFFIEQGEAELWRPELYEDEMKLTKHLGMGDYFGEEALVTGGVRNARIRMTCPSRLQVLEKKDFDELINATLIDRVGAGVANAMLEEGARLLDVRYQEEYEMEYIPGCSLIPLLELRERVGELTPGTDYVVYCHSGNRSDVAVMILREHNLRAVSLIGGIRDWPYAIEHPD